MKNIIRNLFTAVMLLAISASWASAQSTESRQVSGFTGIASAGPFAVHIKIDGTESLKITAQNSSDAEVIKLIETEVENGVLKIKYKDNLHDGQGNTEGPVDIYVSAKSINSLVKTGSGSLIVEEGTVTGSEVKVVVTGSGSVTAAIKSDNLNTVITGSGSMHLSGTVNKTHTVISGSGQMDSRKLEVKEASIVITGSGSAYLTADDTLSAHVTGSGEVVYSGNATVTGSKHIRKAD